MLLAIQLSSLSVHFQVSAKKQKLYALYSNIPKGTLSHPVPVSSPLREEEGAAGKSKEGCPGPIYDCPAYALVQIEVWRRHWIRVTGDPMVVKRNFIPLHTFP